MASKKKQLLIGFLGILSVAFVIVIAWLGMFLPGFLGDFFRGLVGVFSTPFLLEPAFFIMGLIVILTINHWRRKKEGDELVFLEQVENPEKAKTLPSHSRSAVYKDAPLKTPENVEIAVIEGAIDNGDIDLATDQLMTLPKDKLEILEVLKLRLKLAIKREDSTQVEILKKKIAKKQL